MSHVTYRRVLRSKVSVTRPSPYVAYGVL